MSDPRDQLQVGLAERYVLERELGRGGMATVYLARDLRHERLVALKVPSSRPAWRRTSSLRNVRTAGWLTHPDGNGGLQRLLAR